MSDDLDRLDKFAAWVLFFLGACAVLVGAIVVGVTCLMLEFFGAIWTGISWLAMIVFYKFIKRIVDKEEDK